MPVFEVRTVRELKGCALSVLNLLGLCLSPVSQEWLERSSGYTDKPVSQALAYLREEGWACKTSSGWSLAEGQQLLLPASRNYSDSTLSSSSKLIKDSEFLIDSISTTTPSRNISDSVDDLEQIKRIFAATPYLFGDPGVFTKGLCLETIRIDDLMGWLYAGMKAEHVRNRAGVAYNGIKSGERPPSGYQGWEYKDFPFEFQVEIGQRTVQCTWCHKEEFTSMAAYDAHYSACILIPLPEEEEPEQEEFEYLGDDTVAGKAWADVLKVLREEMPKASFETWVRDTRVAEYQEKEGWLVVGARNSYSADWLTSRLSETCKRILSNRLGRDIRVRFIVVE